MSEIPKGRTSLSSLTLRPSITDDSMNSQTLEEVVRSLEEAALPPQKGDGAAGLAHLARMVNGVLWRGDLESGSDQAIDHGLGRIPVALVLVVDLGGNGGSVQGTPTSGPNDTDWTSDAVYVRASVESEYALVVT